jgi:EmrB/QacA subfamily drug resistance transporter
MDEGALKKYQTATLVTMMISSFVATFTSSALNLAIPAISAEFEASATLMNWIMTAYILCSAMFSVPFSRLADIAGRRVIYITGVIIFSLFAGLCAFASSVPMMIVFRVIQGIGGAMIFCTNTAILVNAFPREKRGKVLGYMVMTTYAGLSLGPVLGGVLTHNIGWRSVFFTMMIFGVLAVGIALVGLPRTDDRDREFTGRDILDIPGMLLYMPMIFCLMYGFTSVSGSVFNWFFVVAGVIIAIIFGRHELRAKHPVLKIRLFTENPNFLFSNLASLLNYGATFAVTYLLSLYLQLIGGFDAQSAGLLLILQPVMQTIVSPVAGRLSDKRSPYKLASMGMGLCAATLISFIFISTDTQLPHILVNLAVIGVGFGLFSSPNNNAIMSSVPPEDSNVASSLLATMRNLGHVTSMAVLTLIMSAQLGTATFQQATPLQLVGTMRTGFIVFAAVCVAGVFVSLQRKKKA